MGLPAHAAALVGWSGMMRTIGAISDTQGLVRPQALAALAGCDPIIHAGDVGSPDVLARLGALAPVHAVRGNVDHGAWSTNLPVTQRIEIDGFRIYVLHILAELDPQAAASSNGGSSSSVSGAAAVTSASRSPSCLAWASSSSCWRHSSLISALVITGVPLSQSSSIRFRPAPAVLASAPSKPRRSNLPRAAATVCRSPVLRSF